MILERTLSITARDGDQPAKSRRPIRGFTKSESNQEIVRLSPQLLPQESTEGVDAAARRVWRKKPNKGIQDRSIKDVQKSPLINPYRVSKVGLPTSRKQALRILYKDGIDSIAGAPYKSPSQH